MGRLLESTSSLPLSATVLGFGTHVSTRYNGLHPRLCHWPYHRCLRTRVVIIELSGTEKMDDKP